VSIWRVFLRQISSPFEALLIVAASSLLGTRNEYRAERTIEALRRRISSCANVSRQGEVGTIALIVLVHAVAVEVTKRYFFSMRTT
jgi:magnesium-transporting ATPase (P-type)